MGNLDVIEDRENVQPISMDFEPVLPGRYTAKITESEVKTTAKGGLMLKLTWELLDPGFEGRKVWGQLNIKNDSEKAQAIGRGQLSSLSKACGKTGIPEDSMALHEIKHTIKVAIEESPGYGAKNVVKAFYPLTGTVIAEPARKVEFQNVPVVNAEEDEIPF